MLFRSDSYAPHKKTAEPKAPQKIVEQAVRTAEKSIRDSGGEYTEDDMVMAMGMFKIMLHAKLKREG